MSNDLQKEIEIRKDAIKEAYERSMAYTNIIIVAGYAGIFTLWGLTKDNLSDNAAFLTGLLIGLSIFVFCGWEVFKMIYTSSTLRKKVNMLNTVNSLEELQIKNQKIRNEAISHTVKMYTAWYFVLIAAIGTGFGGALLLFYNFIAGIFALPSWPT